MKLCSLGSLIAFLYHNKITFYKLMHLDSHDFLPYLFEIERQPHNSALIYVSKSVELSYVQNSIETYAFLINPQPFKFSCWIPKKMLIKQLEIKFRATCKLIENQLTTYPMRIKTLPTKLTKLKLGDTFKSRCFDYQVVVGPISFDHYIELQHQTSTNILFKVDCTTVPCPLLNKTKLGTTLLISPNLSLSDTIV